MSGREELEARLEAARAAGAQLVRAREERAEIARLEFEIEAAERAVVDEEAIAAAEEEYGPVGRAIAIVETDLGAVVLKRPHAATFQKFQDVGKMRTRDLDALVRPCLVHPDRAGLDRILKELPATLVRLANAVSELAGARAEEVSGK